MRVLVLGAGGPAGVNFLQSLSLNPGMELYGADINRWNLNFAKPFCKEVFLLPYSHEDSKEIVIRDIISEHNIDFVHAQPDPEVLWLAEYASRIPPARCFLPPFTEVYAVQNKKWCAEQWSSEWPDIAPVFLSDINLIESLGTAWNKFHNNIWIRAIVGAGGKASLHPTTLDEAYKWCQFWFEHDPGIVLIAQKYLTGRNLAWMSLWCEGKLIASQGRERLQYIYPGLTISRITGTPVIARTINDELVNYTGIRAVKLVSKKPHGIYCVDMKEHGNYIYPTEINIGRFFTTSYFFAWAGVQYGVPRANIPNLYVKTGMGEPIPKGKSKNLLPPDLYWVRHVDSPPRLLKREELV